MWFDERRSLATGIAVAGSGVGTFALAPLAEFLIEQLEWRTTFQVLAAAAFVIIIAAGTSYAPVQKDHVEASAPQAEEDGRDAKEVELTQVRLEEGSDGAGEQNPPSSTPAAEAAQAEVFYPIKGSFSCVGRSLCRCLPPQHQAMWSDDPFARLGVSIALAGFGYFTPFSHLYNFAYREVGLSAGASARLVSVIGIASTIGRVVMGRIADQSPVVRNRLFLLSVIAVGISTTLLAPPFLHNEPYLIIFSLVLGAFSGALISLLPVLVSDMLTPQLYPVGLGYIYSVQSLTVLLGPPVAGWVRVASETYTWSWLLSGLSLTISGAIMLTIRVRSVLNAQEEDQESPLNVINDRKSTTNAAEAWEKEDDHRSMSLAPLTKRSEQQAKVV